ncbi:PREDICTED: septin-5-like [Bison bison bison]|uniref:Septin-5-like n=1 Tax=Bison bison bison TaxID=43346 RepID=A0A6P3HF25_BISBB|nr:PREDICTED: septin-5-like [Bison bison bison]
MDSLIREEIDKFGIHVYQFPECDSDEDEDFKQQDRELKVSLQRLGDPRGHATAGESGLGKSTLVHSLFLTDLYKERKLLSAEERISQTVEILKHTVDIEEKGVKLKLTIVDTPGFGDAVNNSECWKPITDYVDQQFEQYFRDESGLNRKNIQDNRVHCCLYFISPFGHGSPCKRHQLWLQLATERPKESAPFAVIGSNTVVEAKGQRVRGRLYPWGIVEVENQAHCDFVKLRNMLIRTHMHDLKDVTCDVHYENYRAHCIQQMTRCALPPRRPQSPPGGWERK